MKRAHSSWTYRRVDHGVGVEMSDWLGRSSPSLSMHFHEEAQISIVYAGHRVFQIGEQCFQIAAGEFALIPAGVPHLSRGCNDVLTQSRDIFLKPSDLTHKGDQKILIGSVAHLAPFHEEVPVDRWLHELSSKRVNGAALQLKMGLPSELVRLVRDTRVPIRAVAARSSLSREGFIRKFAREFGMTPHAYRLAHRATQARALLRDHLAPAAAAYACGFSDQSHLGRVFRRNFGTTPALYRRAWQS